MKMNEHIFTFSEVVTATGVEETWLRTFIQRDKLGKLGVRDDRLRRLLFSGADVLRISVLGSLNAQLKVSPSGSWEVVQAVEDLFTAKIGNGNIPPDTAIRVGYSSSGNLLCWNVDQDGVLESFNDAADDDHLEMLLASRRTHIVIPMAGLFEAISKVMKMAGRDDDE